MKRYLQKLVCLALGAVLLFGAAGCVTESGQEEIIANAPIDGEEIVNYNEPEWDQSPQPFPGTPKPEALPTPNPSPTRPPMEGDIAGDRFPNYDTGWEADWSYQSDELRIAVTRYENEEDRVVFYVADIWMRNINCFRLGFGNGAYSSGREDPEDFANRENAIFAVSGTMNSGLIIQDGTQYKKVENSDIAFRSGIVVIYRDGSVKMINRAKKEKFDLKKENAEHGGVLHALQFGPILVKNGEIPKGLKKNERHPRIIFGYCEPGHYIAVAVDGRTKKSIGMTEQEMAELMLALGCTDAINLDGGNSAVMLFMGKTINIPSGKDKDGDGIAGRNVADLLMFAEYDADGSAPVLSSVVPDKVHGE